MVAGSTGYIGVATTALPRKRQIAGKSITRPSMQYIRLAHNAFGRGAHLYLFDPQKVDWSTGQVRAWVPVNPAEPRGNWVLRIQRLPDVIYENVYVHLAVKGYSDTLRREARKRRIPLYNPVLPGKWRMIEVLRSNDMLEFTPETERLRSVSQGMQRVAQWGVVYIKPIGGYGGMDVARVERLGPNQYRVSVDRTKRQTAQMRMTISEPQLRHWIERRLQRPHIVQRGLNLMSVNGRKVDFRVVLHRDGFGDWQLVGIIPKIAQRDGVVTNIIAGGERTDVDKLSAMAAREGKRIPVEELESRAKQIALVLSRRHPTVGLVGFDMAVEENGKVSMIEMNPKPARSLLSVPMLEQLASYTVGFALFLARRNRKSGGVTGSPGHREEAARMFVGGRAGR